MYDTLAYNFLCTLTPYDLKLGVARKYLNFWRESTCLFYAQVRELVMLTPSSSDRVVNSTLVLTFSLNWSVVRRCESG
jgi:hypothetical protein